LYPFYIFIQEKYINGVVKIIYKKSQDLFFLLHNLGKKMCDIKKYKPYVVSILDKLRLRFLSISKKGNHYVFFLFFKIAVFVIFGLGFSALILGGEISYITPIHASVDEEVEAEKEIRSESVKYSQVFISGRLMTGFDAEVLGVNGETGTGGAVDLINPVDQGSAFLWNNTIELKETIPTDSRTAIRKYVVRPGDTPSEIAGFFGLSLNTLLWANALSSADYIQPGDELTILPIDGLVYEVRYGDTISTIASRHSADADDILRVNEIDSAAHIAVGQELILPGGVKPAAVRYVARSQASVLQNLGGYFVRPTVGGISQYLHSNNGVDIAGGCWQPIYAAASGNVDISVGNGRWNGGFGNYVKLSHPNGTATLYAHMIQTSVSPGQYVGQGQLIGYTGSTGRSTGCHLHFEVHGARNPLG